MKNIKDFYVILFNINLFARFEYTRQYKEVRV